MVSFNDVKPLSFLIKPTECALTTGQGRGIHGLCPVSLILFNGVICTRTRCTTSAPVTMTAPSCLDGSLQGATFPGLASSLRTCVVCVNLCLLGCGTWSEKCHWDVARLLAAWPLALLSAPCPLPHCRGRRAPHCPLGSDCSSCQIA